MDQNLPDSGQPVNIRAIFIVFLAIAILAGAVGYAVNRNRTDNQEEEVAQENQEVRSELASIAPNTFVYGTWSGENALIKSVDFESGAVQSIAKLTEKIKKVTVLNSDQILYIYNTNNYDHGRELVVYSLTDKKDYGVYKAEEGFGIDDYVVSPDGRYVATWEVAFKEGEGRLVGGQSRVYVANIENPDQKNLLYDEAQTGTTPIHYPVAVTDSGDVFTDRFLPGTVFGWGYGMSYANLDGSVKEDIEDMKDGMYGSQPTVSVDGRYLVFTGYTSPKGPSTVTNRPTERAGANTIELLDLQNRTKRKLTNVSTADSYLTVQWDGADLIYYAFGRGERTGYYRYNLGSQTAKKIAIEDVETDMPIGTLGNGKILVGVDQMGGSTVSNLGNSYSLPFSRMYTVDIDGTVTPVNLKGGVMQFITLLPAGFFADASADGETASVLANGNNNKNRKNNKKNNKNANNSNEAASNETFKEDSECEGYDNLQLCPFYFKALERREEQQTIPACYDGLIGPECQRQGNTYKSDSWKACVRENVRPYRKAGLCGGSPLYLYGTAGTNVTVRFGTDIFGAVPSYNGKYDITLGNNGKMNVNGGTFERLSYDYTPALKNITRPSKGKIVKQSEVTATLTEYGQKLGLNEKEINDLVVYGTKEVVSPYVFISYFDHKTSSQMLPITFSPVPDNYLNTVFYFRLLKAEPNVSVAEPDFTSPVKRDGFTAVEVSGFVE